MKINTLLGIVITTPLVLACSEGGNTNGFNGQLPGSLPIGASDIDFGPEPELQPEIIPDNLMPPPPLGEGAVNDDGLSEDAESDVLVEANSLFIPPASIIDPITSVREIESNTENLLNEYEDLLRQYLVQANDIHQLIGSGIQTSDNPDVLRYDVDFYNELLACEPRLNQYSQIDAFECGETTATLNFRQTEYPDVLITLDKIDSDQRVFGPSFSTIIQNNSETNDFVISIMNVFSDDGNTLIVTRSPEDFTCTVGYWPFSFDEINQNACNATLEQARDIIKPLLGY